LKYLENSSEIEFHRLHVQRGPEARDARVRGATANLGWDGLHGALSTGAGRARFCAR
jgi:hypothetical protein